MNSKDKAFSQVKAILGKIDRSIDEARAKRLGYDTPGPEEAKPQHPLRAKPLRKDPVNSSTAWRTP